MRWRLAAGGDKNVSGIGVNRRSMYRRACAAIVQWRRYRATVKIGLYNREPAHVAWQKRERESA